MLASAYPFLKQSQDGASVRILGRAPYASLQAVEEDNNKEMNQVDKSGNGDRHSSGSRSKEGNKLQKQYWYNYSGSGSDGDSSEYSYSTESREDDAKIDSEVRKEMQNNDAVKVTSHENTLPDGNYLS